MTIFIICLFLFVAGIIKFWSSLAKKKKKEYEDAIASTGFHADYILKSGILRMPLFAIDAQKQLFYIHGRSSRVFHASEVTHISLQSPAHNKHELCLTVTDLEEPKRYIVFGGMREVAETWYGRVEAIWNSR